MTRAAEGAAPIDVGAVLQQPERGVEPSVRRCPPERRPAIGIGVETGAARDELGEDFHAVGLRRPDERLVENLLRFVLRNPDRKPRMGSIEASAGARWLGEGSARIE